MERKSIGQFIAVLRKSKGMTQKQLAEMLAVSDKAVSRWERDETVPDVTLIPVIAEIFGVTSDEILRGERIVRTNDIQEEKSPKGEKRLKNLLETTATNFKIRSVISIAVAIIGLILAMIFNFALLRAELGFFSGCILLVTAITMEIIFTISTTASVNSEDFNEEIIKEFKERIIKNCILVLLIILCIFAFILPLIILSYDAYSGLTAPDWFAHGITYSVICAIISFLSMFLAKQIYIQKRITTYTEKEKNKYLTQRKFIGKVAVIILVTFITQFVFNTCFDHFILVKGTTYTDPFEFIQFMETPMGDDDEDEFTTGSPIPDYIIPTESVYEENADDTYSAVVSDEANPEYEEDEDMDEENQSDFYVIDKITVNGKEELIKQRNFSIVSYKVKYDKEGNFVSAKTYTNKDLERCNNIVEIVNIVFLVSYGLEIVSAIVTWFKKEKS